MNTLNQILELEGYSKSDRILYSYFNSYNKTRVLEEYEEELDTTGYLKIEQA